MIMQQYFNNNSWILLHDLIWIMKVFYIEHENWTNSQTLRSVYERVGTDWVGSGQVSVCVRGRATVVMETLLARNHSGSRTLELTEHTLPKQTRPWHTHDFTHTSVMLKSGHEGTKTLRFWSVGSQEKEAPDDVLRVTMFMHEMWCVLRGKRAICVRPKSSDPEQSTNTNTTVCVESPEESDSTERARILHWEVCCFSARYSKKQLTNAIK